MVSLAISSALSVAVSAVPVLVILPSLLSVGVPQVAVSQVVPWQYLVVRGLEFHLPAAVPWPALPSRCIWQCRHRAVPECPGSIGGGQLHRPFHIL